MFFFLSLFCLKASFFLKIPNFKSYQNVRKAPLFEAAALTNET